MDLWHQWPYVYGKSVTRVDHTDHPTNSEKILLTIHVMLHMCIGYMGGKVLSQNTCEESQLEFRSTADISILDAISRFCSKQTFKNT